MTLLLATSVMAGTAQAGELAVPSKRWSSQAIVGRQMVLRFLLTNRNSVYALGPVQWTITVRYLLTQAIMFQLAGSTFVGAGQSLEAIPELAWTPTMDGAHQVTIEANSEANITGPQTLMVNETVLASTDCTTRPALSPGNLLIATSSGSITYTAPKGCCYKVMPFMNSETFWDMTPDTEQTISDGQSVTFTMTAKGNPAMATAVGFAWRECEKGTPKGHDYVVVSPRMPPSNGDTVNGTDGPHIWTSTFGDPVSPRTGTFVLQEDPDLDFGVGPLRFERLYDGMGITSGFISNLGFNWTHTYDASVVVTPTEHLVQLPGFERAAFTKVGSTYSLRSMSTNVLTLQDHQGGWLLTDATRLKQYTFNAQGMLTKIDDGAMPVYVVWNGSSLARVTDSLGHVITFTTNDQGRIITASNGTLTCTYAYSTAQELASVTSSNGFATTYAYGAIPGQITSVDRGAGVVEVSNTYDASGRITAQTDAEGRASTYTYSSSSSRYVDGAGVAEDHTWNMRGQVTSIGTGTTAMRFTYNINNRPSMIISAGGDTTLFTWHESGRPASIRHGAGGMERWEYRQRQWNGATVWDCTNHIDEVGRRITFDRDSRGWLSGIGGATRPFTYTRDTQTGLITEARSMSATTMYTYDASGHITSMRNALGATTTFITNGRGDVTKISYPDTSSISFEYDTQGKVTKYTDEMGASTSWTYDRWGRVSSETGPGSVTTTYGIDRTGRMTRMSRAGRDAVTFDYDDAGRLTTTHVGSSIVTSREYDNAGWLSAIADAESRKELYTNNADGYITKHVARAGGMTEFQHDGRGLITDVTTPTGGAEAFRFDASGDVIDYRDASQRFSAFTYGRTGQISRWQHGPVNTVMTYDTLGRITSCRDTDGGTWNYAYNAMDLVTKRTDPSGSSTTYDYDLRGRVRSITDAQGVVTLLRRDKRGNIIEQRRASDLRHTYTYDVAGRPTSTTRSTSAYDATGTLTQTNGVAITWNTNGTIASIGVAPGKDITYTYDAMFRVRTVTDWTGATITLRRDANGSIIETQRSGALTTRYTRDASGALTMIEESPTVSMTIARFADGRISSIQSQGYLDGPPLDDDRTLTYSSANTLMSPMHPSVGQLITDGYDRVVGVRSGTDSAIVVHNDALGGLPQSVLVNGQLWVVLSTAQDGLFGMVNVANGEHRYFHYDASGNVVAVSDDNGTIVSRFAYGAYGEPLASDGETQIPFQFGGQRGTWTPGASQYVMGTRVYDATTGRFTTEDPVEQLDPRAFNAYAYAWGDPVNAHDASGATPEANLPAPDWLEESRRNSDRAIAKAAAINDIIQADEAQRELDRQAERRAREVRTRTRPSATPKPSKPTKTNNPPPPTPAPVPTPPPAPAPAPVPGGKRAPAGGSNRGSYLPDWARDILEYFIVF
ncbi:MAG: RHS repeat protein [Ignavibacteria bacterium]|nr:RHS repeat protein [Ignavibacteria bacterium]